MTKVHRLECTECTVGAPIILNDALPKTHIIKDIYSKVHRVHYLSPVKRYKNEK